MVSKRIFVFLLFLEVVIKCCIEANTWQRWGNVCLTNKTPRNSKLAFRKSQSTGRWLNWINQSEGEFMQLVQSTEKWERASQIGFEFSLIGFECGRFFSQPPSVVQGKNARSLNFSIICSILRILRDYLCLTWVFFFRRLSPVWIHLMWP